MRCYQWPRQRSVMHGALWCPHFEWDSVQVCERREAPLPACAVPRTLRFFSTLKKYNRGNVKLDLENVYRRVTG